MGDPYLVRKSGRGYHRCAIKGSYRSVASFYYCGNARGSYDFTGDPDAANRYPSFELANAARLKLERSIGEALDLSRLSDAVKLLDEGYRVVLTTPPMLDTAKAKKPAKPADDPVKEMPKLSENETPDLTEEMPKLSESETVEIEI